MTFTITREYLYLGVTIVLLLIQVWQMFKIDALKKEIDNIWNQIHIIAISAGNTLQKLENKIDEKQDAVTHKEIKLLSYGRPNIIVENNNNQYFIAGLVRGMDVTAGTISNGTPISATTVRQSLMNDDYETFRASYPQFNDAKIKNAWQILKGIQEASIFSKDWWTTELQEEIDEVFGATMNKAETLRHKKKLRKLNTFLDKQDDQSFVYDFDQFPKTVMGVDLNESKLLSEGGAAGHMAHPYDDHGLTFNDMKKF